MGEPDFEWLMIDATHCKVHPHVAHIPRRQSGNEPYKRGLNTKIHLAVNALGLPVRVTITEGEGADCSEACRLIDGFEAEYLLADRGYDTNEITHKVESLRSYSSYPTKEEPKKATIL